MLKSIEITEAEALPLWAIVTEPKWTKITNRFESITDPETPAGVQTALLSLTYSHGSRALDYMTPAVESALKSGEWCSVAQQVERHDPGKYLQHFKFLTKRRHLEGDLIRQSAKIDVADCPIAI